MNSKNRQNLNYIYFNPQQLKTVNDACEVAEELVSDSYKMSSHQWLRSKYDINTMKDLQPDEIDPGSFAQIIRYEGKKKDTSLGSALYDFYKICLQDHFILTALQQDMSLQLYPFSVYIVTHELVHIVRFSKFIQGFKASQKEKLKEEALVHEKTRIILKNVQIEGLSEVLGYYINHLPIIEELKNT